MEKNDILEMWERAMSYLESWCVDDHDAHPKNAISHLENDPLVHKVLALGGNGHGPYLVLPHKGQEQSARGVCASYNLTQTPQLQALKCIERFSRHHPERLLEILSYIKISDI